MSASNTPRRKPGYPDFLTTDLSRFKKTVHGEIHGHNGSSRIVMVRKTDQRTFASIKNGQEPKLETITRETVETFRGPRTACKITTEKKNSEEKVPPDLISSLRSDRSPNIQNNKKVPSKIKMSGTEAFLENCLQAHNDYRKKHGAAPLKLNKEISKVSQNWANHLIRLSTLQHSSNKQYGENIYCMQSSDPNFTVAGKEPVDNWYNEIKVHQFGVEPRSLDSGHFTQVVWKDSEELGVGYAKQGGRVIVVANYYPPGNYIGRYNDNVLPPGSSVIRKIEEGLSKLSLKSKPSDNGAEANFEEDFINAHNKYRKLHGVPLLKLDKKLSKYSEEWAKHLASKNVLEHRPNCNYGENIFSVTSTDPKITVKGNAPVDRWYDEVKNHTFGKEPTGLGTGHFTQVIWKSSELLGVGVAKNQGTVYIVANYSPAGNFVGQYVENVPPPLSSPTKVVSSKILESKINGTGEFSSFALEGLAAHNEYRRKHVVPELRLNKKMCDYAQDWANTCAQKASMSHRPNGLYGENIFLLYSSDTSFTPSAADAVKAWYDEVKLYSFGTESVKQGTLHFTQVVWKESTELGIGMAKNGKGETYVVANYNPKGNYMGKFTENVFRPRQ